MKTEAVQRSAIARRLSDFADYLNGGDLSALFHAPVANEVAARVELIARNAGPAMTAGAKRYAITHFVNPWQVSEQP
ncbi:hypothetical protein ABZ330_16270 [Streptomyces sp. NPDC006172]|uniref:hypothetical protein n=1 Tax=Streptomyces sp. NPDC006172 TaxID=3154470 RepID=UPI0033D71508